MQFTPTIQFSISTYAVSSIEPINRALSGATTPGQTGPGSDGNEGVFRIPRNSSTAGNSPSDYLVSYQDTRKEVLPLCRGAVSVFFSPSRLGKVDLGWFLYLILYQTSCVI